MDPHREGFLNKAGKGLLQTRLQSWRPRYFVMDGKHLKYYRSKEIVEENILGCIELSEVESVSLMKNEKHSFQITTKSPKSRTYFMSGKSDDEVMGWVNVIEMAKARVPKHSSENTSAIDVYDEVKPPPKNIKRSIRSEYTMLGAISPPPTPVPYNNPNTATKSVPSEYELVGSLQRVGDNSNFNAKNVDDDSVFEDTTYAVVTNQPEPLKRTSVKEMDAANSSKTIDDDETLAADPTYDMVLANKSEPPKTSVKQGVKIVDDVYDEPTMAARDADDLYDTVDVKAGKSSVNIPPPLPMRPDSLSEKQAEKTVAVGVYDEACQADVKSSSGNEIRDVNVGSREEKKVVNSAGAEEKKVMPIYAKPIHAKPIRTPSSKKKMNPAMVDIGEVAADVEEDSAGGRESLKRGMTQPIGDRFAFVELKELLEKYDEDDSNNPLNEQNDVTLDNFNVEEGVSPFDTLKRFLEKCK